MCVKKCTFKERVGVSKINHKKNIYIYNTKTTIRIFYQTEIAYYQRRKKYNNNKYISMEIILGLQRLFINGGVDPVCDFFNGPFETLFYVEKKVIIILP